MKARKVISIAIALSFSAAVPSVIAIGVNVQRAASAVYATTERTQTDPNVVESPPEIIAPQVMSPTF
jgi:hypothetical protein